MNLEPDESRRFLRAIETKIVEIGPAGQFLGTSCLEVMES